MDSRMTLRDGVLVWKDSGRPVRARSQVQQRERSMWNSDKQPRRVFRTRRPYKSNGRMRIPTSDEQRMRYFRGLVAAVVPTLGASDGFRVRSDGSIEDTTRAYSDDAKQLWAYFRFVAARLGLDIDLALRSWWNRIQSAGPASLPAGVPVATNASQRDVAAARDTLSLDGLKQIFGRIPTTEEVLKVVKDPSLVSDSAWSVIRGAGTSIIDNKTTHSGGPADVPVSGKDRLSGRDTDGDGIPDYLDDDDDGDGVPDYLDPDGSPDDDYPF